MYVVFTCYNDRERFGSGTFFNYTDALNRIASGESTVVFIETVLFSEVSPRTKAFHAVKVCLCKTIPCP